MRAAIYSRQSKEKEDSLSIESQEDFCSSICKENGWEYDFYKDPGLSGGDIERPDFQKMMALILAGKYQRVIVYRLDRVNRDMADFANMLKVLERHDIIFQSATEPFDTSTPFGRAWAYNTMNYAEMERRRAMERGKENFLYRVSKGHYPGGHNPFGYRVVKVQHEGKAANTLEPDEIQAPYVRYIFDLYVNKKIALHRIALILNQEGIPTVSGGTWRNEKVRRTLKNPVYTENTIDVFEYFVALGVSVMQGPESFDGAHGCLLVEKEVMGKHRKLNPPEKQRLSVGLHRPLVSADIWLQAQRTLTMNGRRKRRGTGHSSWTIGFMKCAHCGYSMSTKQIKRQGQYITGYFICSGHNMRGDTVCTAKKHHNAGEVEAEIEKRLFAHLRDVDLDGVAVNYSPETTFEINALRAKEIEIIQQIDDLIDKSFEGVVRDYIQARIEKLDKERQGIRARLFSLRNESHVNSNKNIKQVIETILTSWDELSITEKHSLAENIISGITLSSDMVIDIAWIF
jgi:DNA invertase Pin-like site-specific DNA recombinase